MATKTDKDRQRNRERYRERMQDPAQRELHRQRGRRAYRQMVARNPDWVQDRNYRKHYGLTLAQVQDMTAKQGGVCYVCQGPPDVRGSLHVDHNHRTGAIRKLLCTRCNAALGMVDDDPARLRALIAYLEEH